MQARQRWFSHAVPCFVHNLWRIEWLPNLLRKFFVNNDIQRGTTFPFFPLAAPEFGLVTQN
jgi:hypothetical protein